MQQTEVKMQQPRPADIIRIVANAKRTRGSERTTIPWVDEEYGHLNVGGRRFPLVYYPNTMNEAGDILWYHGPGNTTFYPNDSALEAPVHKRVFD
jgi:hypothetical protein